MRWSYMLLLALGSMSAVSQVHADKPATPNQQGWVSLFDGKTTNGWTTVQGEKVMRGWVVTPQGELHRNERGGHIVSERSYHRFELEMEWKIATGGNSGVKYRLAPHLNTLWGLEYQLFDDLTKQSRQKPNYSSCGALYNLYPPKESRPIKPAGEWNTLRIVVNDTKIEHWLNGEKIVDADTSSEDWANRLAKSKYRPVKNFAPNEPTRILLQDHGSEVWFRNIRIRPL